jgi:hypothetical protein
MSQITLQSIETSVGDIFVAAVHRAQSFIHTVAADADVVVADVAKVLPFAQAILSKVAPQDAAALALFVQLINAINGALQSTDAAAQKNLADVLGDDVVGAFKGAKSALLKFENSL